MKLTDFRRVANELFQKIPWESWGIKIEKFSKAAYPCKKYGDDFYPEKTASEFIFNTMVVFLEDYVFRRRGFEPSLFYHQNPNEFKKLMMDMAKILELSAEESINQIKELTHKLDQ